MTTLDIVMNITVTVPVPKNSTGEKHYGKLINKSDSSLIKLLKDKKSKIRIYSIEDFDGSCDVKENQD